MAVKPPFAGEQWVREGHVFVRAGTDDRWTYHEEPDAWRWTCADGQWNAVLAAVPEALLAHTDLNVARVEFNEAASDCLALVFYHHTRFAEGSPVKAWRKQRKNIEASLLDVEPSTSLSYQYHLTEALYLADAAIAAFEMEGEIHTGRRSPERDWLYSRLLELWTKRFNGKLTTGRSSIAKEGKRMANSPATRFLLAALTPILRDDMIGAEAAEKIVEAEIKRRKQMPETAASWKKLFTAMERRAKKKRAR